MRDPARKLDFVRTPASTSVPATCVTGRLQSERLESSSSTRHRESATGNHQSRLSFDTRERTALLTPRIRPALVARRLGRRSERTVPSPCHEPIRGRLTQSLAQHDPAQPSVDTAEVPVSSPAASSFSEAPPPSEPIRVSDAGASSDAESSASEAGTSAELDAEDSESDEARRTIKRYSNRKLYDTRQSRYVTLLQIAEMVRAGEDVQIIDNATKEDKTDVTLALIISEELKARPRAIPLATLKALIRHRGGKLLTQLRESPIGRLMPRDENGAIDHHVSGLEVLPDGPPHAEDSQLTKEQLSKEQHGGLRRTLEQWHHTIDDRIRAVVPHFSALQELQGEVHQLSKRLEELEKRLDRPRE